MARLDATDLEIVRVDSPGRLSATVDLLRDFVRWQRGRYADELGFVDAYFESAAWEDELAQLDRKYAPPDGALLLATKASRPAGCIAVRRLGAGACEMKRLFVRPEFQGCGIGRRLVAALLALARARGYATMRLDTGRLQHEAQSLYRSLGFRIVPPYYECAPEVRSRLVFMECTLGS